MPFSKIARTHLVGVGCPPLLELFPSLPSLILFGLFNLREEGLGLRYRPFGVLLFIPIAGFVGPGIHNTLTGVSVSVVMSGLVVFHRSLSVHLSSNLHVPQNAGMAFYALYQMLRACFFEQVPYTRHVLGADRGVNFPREFTYVCSLSTMITILQYLKESRGLPVSRAKDRLLLFKIQ